ncbi:glycoside hydrolase family 99-like domain-containing protein [Methylocystis parvus OBBP]|nr:glycoside hydrolase family 99-like domain-containing protein [Methylocystis parvus]WBK01965.1 glycoside hydrolase family 99-like domain-containing protein [Methylocystis parvus OBBP]
MTDTETTAAPITRDSESNGQKAQFPAKIKAVAGTDCYDLVETEIGGAFAYVSIGPDPQMILCDPETREHLQLPKGKYRFFFQARITKGRIYRPRLYLNMGEGFSEADDLCVFMRQVVPDVWCGDIYATRHIYTVRFDPSEAQVRFTLIRLAIEDWSPDHLTFGENFYKTLRASYRALPNFLIRRGPLAVAAELTARSLFGGTRKSVRDREIAQAIAEPQIEAPPNDARSADHNLEFRTEFYKEALSVSAGARDSNYAPLPIARTSVAEDNAHVLAFYLPQFHPFPENDEWWGRGFTEWTNVSKAVPQFKGHYQPRLPGELGFYDLRLSDVMARQFELARHFGVQGFCFHYYWFGGKRLLERPVETLLASKDESLNFPFCLCWANENWTRRWDGAEHEVLMKQDHSDEDHERVFDDLLRYFRDPRYIRIDGKPLVVVYRPLIVTNVEKMAEIWRRKAAEAGLPGIYLVATTAFGFSDPLSIGFDALVQFPPHAVSVPEITAEVELFNSDFQGCVYDYRETVDAYLEILDETLEREKKFAYFPGVMTAWDNVARKQSRGHVFHNASPREFHRWLSAANNFSRKYNDSAERLVFVNAWNEWGEGTYLEPDRKFGYAYLWAVAASRDLPLPHRKDLESIAANVARREPASDTALFTHIFYSDLIDELAEWVSTARRSRKLDVVVAMPETWSPKAAARLVELVDPTRLVIVKNCGRDVLPFLQSLRATKALNYKFGCKLHAKKSLHLASGGRWRRGLIEGLVSKEAVDSVFNAFENDPRVGLAAPRESFMSATEPSVIRDNRANMELLLERAGAADASFQDFVAGTMFWFRVAPLQEIAAMDMGEAAFGPELGAIDGTLAHAFERTFPTLLAIKGYTAFGYKNSGDAAAPY